MVWAPKRPHHYLSQLPSSRGGVGAKTPTRKLVRFRANFLVGALAPIEATCRDAPKMKQGAHPCPLFASKKKLKVDLESTREKHEKAGQTVISNKKNGFPRGKKTLQETLIISNTKKAEKKNIDSPWALNGTHAKSGFLHAK